MLKITLHNLTNEDLDKILDFLGDIEEIYGKKIDKTIEHEKVS